MSKNNKLKTLFVAAYILLCFSGFYAVGIDLLPFPYSKAPLGLPLGGMMALFMVGPVFLTTRRGQWLTLLEGFFIAAMTLFWLFIQKLLPLNLADFHITTNVSRISLIIGFLIGVGMLMVVKYLSIKKEAALDSVMMHD